jgi:RNA-directed DNA polymerase
MVPTITAMLELPPGEARRNRGFAGSLNYAHPTGNPASRSLRPVFGAPGAFQTLGEGRRGKVHALRRILTRSLGAACWAVRRVTTNPGKRTPGMDGVVWSTPKAKQGAIAATQRGPYQPLPLRRVYLPKPNGKKRPLGIPCIKDRAKQAVHTLALDPIAECLADPNSYGFRRERSTADAIEQCFKVLAWRRAARWVLEGGITACYDRISHEWLDKHVPMDKGILRKWLKSGYVERKTFHATEEGAPQGGIISPVLCNLTLDGLERLLQERFKHRMGNMVRYADDFIVTGGSKELLRDEVKPVIEAFLADRGLELSAEKTHIVHIEEGFDFLGQHVRKYNGKLIIKPAKKAVKGLLAKVGGIHKRNVSSQPAEVIRQLNPVIQGWANYHRHVCSKETFSHVDCQI